MLLILPYTPYPLAGVSGGSWKHQKLLIMATLSQRINLSGLKQLVIQILL